MWTIAQGVAQGSQERDGAQSPATMAERGHGQARSPPSTREDASNEDAHTGVQPRESLNTQAHPNDERVKPWRDHDEALIATFIWAPLSLILLVRRVSGVPLLPSPSEDEHNPG